MAGSEEGGSGVVAAVAESEAEVVSWWGWAASEISGSRNKTGGSSEL